MLVICTSCLYIEFGSYVCQSEYYDSMLCLLGGRSAAMTLSARIFSFMSIALLVGSLNIFCFRWLANKIEETLPKFLQMNSAHMLNLAW